MSGQHKIFSASENCLTEDQLLLYIQHKLSPFEQHQVEKHLLDCELCSGALEGLRMASTENLSETFAELNQQIDKRVKQEEKKIIPLSPWLRIAAVIALIAVSAGTFIYLQKEQKQEEKIVAEKKPDLPPPPQNNFELKSSEPVSAETPKKISSKNIKSPVAVIPKTKLEQTEVSKSADATSSGAGAVAEEKAIENLPHPSADQEQISEVVTKKDAEKTDNQYSVIAQPQSVKKSFAENSKTEKNMSERKEVANVESLQLNSALLLSNAKHQMENNRYESANYYLDQVINNNDTKFMEEALWNKAISLEKLNRKEDAKNILQKIVKMNGKYKKKATEKLKE